MKRGRGAITIVAAAFAAGSAVAQKAPKPDAESADAHMREELGANRYTTPGIDLLLKSLAAIKPVPFDKVKRAEPDSIPGDRARVALSAGAVIADGFLAVAAEKQSELAAVGRALLKHAKGLGVAENVTRHSKSILEKGAAKDWDGVRLELLGAQREVERAMMALKDEEIAHLVSLGGWWRGLEITAGSIAENWSAERAALLVQPSLLDYFADRVATLRPGFKGTKVCTVIEAGLREVRALTVREGGAAPGAEDVKKLQAIARGVIEAIAANAE